jgi:DNA modification methylase
MEFGKTDESWSFRQLRRTQTCYLTHDYHKYPAKFIPQLAQRLILENSNPGDLVCDPFMGSGTTLLEAILNSRRGYGSDIHPLSVLISKAKTTSIEPDYLREQISSLLAAISADLENTSEIKTLRTANHSSFIPYNRKIDYWFPQQQKRDLGIILSRINCLDDQKTQTFFLCGFSNILKVCSRWMMKSIKPTRDRHKLIANAYRTFTIQTKRMSIKNQELWNRIGPNKVECTIDNADARRINVQDETAAVIVTSPPYVTSYEYLDLHQLSSIWFRYIDKPLDFRSKFIGSIHKTSCRGKLYSKLAKAIVSELDLVDVREANAVEQYFLEMQECFQEMYRVVKQRGRICIIIGNTQLRRVSVNNAKVFIESMHEIGFKTHKVIKRAVPHKILPSARDEKTGRFCPTLEASRLAYPSEYILIMEKN